MTDLQTLTRKILHDVQSGNAFDPYAEDPPRSLTQAYAIQDALAASLAKPEARGPVAGWKIAANSQQLMTRFKLSEPATGRIFASQRIDGDASLKVADYTEFAFEPEIAAVMKTTLNPQNAPFTRAQVIAAIDRFVPGIELLDMRHTDMPNTHIPDAIAQNISNVGAVVGGPGVRPEDLNADDLQTTVRIDGEVVHDVTGAAPQNPLDAVIWLAGHLASRGLPLEAGQVVFCGTHSPIWYHKGAGRIEVVMSHIGTAALTLG
ncbi:hypothetical protein A8B82_05010 [Sulfitobacter sp. EhC04]|uniref:2-keto-4-pentenoate hydratase n=1 Tax=Sulfitobacter sp. EhC04 TaxID=1849168 RepID=UPI0007F53FC0|nr:fumarylacetoacetate hydrolase family protein [Sulfitobacter sp. EhC04]OAN68253.1 hypothetical protein A8B82_05010 [Sulfitobacter sp. EhC04]